MPELCFSLLSLGSGTGGGRGHLTSVCQATAKVIWLYTNLIHNTDLVDHRFGYRHPAEQCLWIPHRSLAWPYVARGPEELADGVHVGVGARPRLSAVPVVGHQDPLPHLPGYPLVHGQQLDAQQVDGLGQQLLPLLLSQQTFQGLLDEFTRFKII